MAPQNSHRCNWSIIFKPLCFRVFTSVFVLFFRYRAILGPFQWGVWICLIAIYMLAIFPITFSLKYTCSMFDNCGEVGTMLWMVFGTFTNLFTYRGEKSWSNIKTSSTRAVIGWYWYDKSVLRVCYICLPVFLRQI